MCEFEELCGVVVLVGDGVVECLYDDGVVVVFDDCCVMCLF